MKKGLLTALLIVAALFILCSCTGEFKVSLTTSGGGRLSGGGVFNGGDIASINAVPDEDCVFTGWFIGDELVSVEPNFSFTVSESVTLRAEFKRRVTLSVSSSNGQAFGGGSFFVGEEVTVSVEPIEHYAFSGWYIGEERVSESLEYRFFIEDNTEIRAEFIINSYDFAISCGVGGKIKGTYKDRYDYGEKVALKAECEEKYRFVGWFIDGELISKELSFVYVITDNTEIEAKFARGYLLSVIADDGVSVNITEEEYTAGEKIALKASVLMGYTFIGWFKEDETVCESLEYSFVMPESDVIIHVRAANVFEGYTSIASAEELYGIRDDLSGRYVLRCDIDLSEFKSWTPIGCNTNTTDRFTGVLEGCGCKITGLGLYGSYNSIKGSKHVLDIGLFGYIDGGIINNLFVDGEVEVYEDEHSDFTSLNAGILFGRAFGAAIENVTVSGKVNVEASVSVNVGALGGIALGKSELVGCVAKAELKVKGLVFVGGLLGSLKAARAVDCKALNTVITAVSTGSGYLGGIVGYSCGYIEGCEAACELSLNSENRSSLYVGGICAYANRADLSDYSSEPYEKRGYLSACKAVCTIKAEGEGPISAGGFVGLAYDAVAIYGGASSGSVRAESHGSYAYVGGFIGQTCYAGGMAEIERCYSECEVYGFGVGVKESDNCVVSVGGFIGQALSVNITCCYSVGDVFASGKYGLSAVGGFIGGFISYDGVAEIRESYAAPSLIECKSDSYRSYIGGFVGRLYKNVSIAACPSFTEKIKAEIACGDLSLDEAELFAGGFYGNLNAQSDNTLSNCYISEKTDFELSLCGNSVSHQTQSECSTVSQPTEDFFVNTLLWSKTVWTFSTPFPSFL